ncbi:MAG TPA: class I SAM-dependent methyltransferase [Candidatus Absconditabacterales bacterium]|nr:class I SAM-dependent methyltransferase [Candidatus Absconditabacterales bacterium]
MKTIKINLDEFKPHQKVRIEFLREVQFRLGAMLMFFVGSPLFAIICGFGIYKEGGNFWSGLNTIPFMVIIILPIILVSVSHRKMIYQLFHSYIDKSYKWVIYDYENEQLILSDKKIQLKNKSHKKELGKFEKILFFVNLSKGFLWYPTKKIKGVRQKKFNWTDIISIIYYCFIWPFILNPMQLAFLEYDKLKKFTKIQKGANILILGAGALPHHIRYKRYIGKTGKIVVSDNHIPTLWMSKIIEFSYESILKLFGIKRPKIEYKLVDSTDTFPFNDNSFDIIVGIRNYQVDYDECNRVLKNEGIMYFTNLGQWFCNEPLEQKTIIKGETIVVYGQ